MGEANSSPASGLAARANQVRYAGQSGGHYESYFVRANHPSRPLGFWIRYTILSERARPAEARAQLWAIVFDGERGVHTVAKQDRPIASYSSAKEPFEIRIADSSLSAERAVGRALGAAHSVSWDLSYSKGQAPVLLLPETLYEARFPSAKSLVPQPLARFEGTVEVDGTRVSVDDWAGSQNHNWGSRHTDSYAWGQVAGFDNAGDSFLEIASARLKVGPFWTPALTPAVLRHNGRHYSFTSVTQALQARARRDRFELTFACRSRDAVLTGTLSASASSFVGLRYENPPGGTKICLNSKIAECQVRLIDLQSNTTVDLSAVNRAAFEILSDDETLDIEIAA